MHLHMCLRDSIFADLTVFCVEKLKLSSETPALTSVPHWSCLPLIGSLCTWVDSVM